MTTVMLAAAAPEKSVAVRATRKSARLQHENGKAASEKRDETEQTVTVEETLEATEVSSETTPVAAKKVTGKRRCASASRMRADERNKKRRRVSFESADIVEFEPTMFTTSVTSGGIPVGMSLEERSRSRRRLDSWEMERQDERICRQRYMEEGYLDPMERAVILSKAGCGENSMAKVEAEVNQIIAHRRESNEIDYGFLCGLVSIAENNQMLDENSGEEDVEEVQLLGMEDHDVANEHDERENKHDNNEQAAESNKPVGETKR